MTSWRKFLLAFWLAFIAVASLWADQKKLTVDQRVEILRGLDAEYATVKVPLPRSKKPLEFRPTAPTTRQGLGRTAQAARPGGRVGDLVQVTHVTIEKDAIILRDQRRNASQGRLEGSPVRSAWAARMNPVNGGQNANAPGGTTIALRFNEPIGELTSADVKKMLAPVLDFDKQTATEQYVGDHSARSEEGDREQEGDGRHGSRPGGDGAGPSRSQRPRNQGRRPNTKIGSTESRPAA